MSGRAAAAALKPGDWIAHRDLMVNGVTERREGLVMSVLSAQFTYETEDGRRYFCMYSGEWHQAGEAPWLR